MRALEPILVAHASEGVRLNALEAGRTQAGLRATIQAIGPDERVFAARAVRLANADDRTSFAEEVRDSGASDSAGIENALIVLQNEIETVMRARTRGRVQSEHLVSLAREAGLQLCHDDEDVTYARFRHADHFEVHPVQSRGFRRFLIYLYNQSEGRAPSKDAVSQALESLDAFARFAGERRNVFVRVAMLDGRIYLDLADSAWRVAEISAEGWEVIPESPVWFRRAPGITALPEPLRGGRLSRLRELLHIEDGRQWILTVAFLLAALVPPSEIQYPPLILQGPQGSGKTVRAELTRSVIDPSSIPARSAPRDERDLMIAAKNGHIISFDNLSGLAPSLSDALCRLSTGGGFAVRSLYTNDEECLFRAKRPVILNGIDQVATRGDLVDRALILELGPITDQDHMEETVLRAEFDRERPGILGALLDVLSGALRMRFEVRIDHLPRMADLAVWMTAAEPTLGWPEGTFLREFNASRAEALVAALDADPLAESIRVFLTLQHEWQGRATDLLELLPVADAVRGSRRWPKSGSALSNRLGRLGPALAVVGIVVHVGRNNRGSHVTLRLAGQNLRHDRHAGQESAHHRDPTGDGRGPTSRHSGPSRPSAASPSRNAATSPSRPMSPGRADLTASDDGDGDSPWEAGRRIERSGPIQTVFPIAESGRDFDPDDMPDEA
jgi:hypothetical protein